MLMEESNKGDNDLKSHQLKLFNKLYKQRSKLKEKILEELEKCRRELEENYQQQLRRQGEEIKKDLFKHFEDKLKNIEDLKIKLQSEIDDIRKIFSTLQSENIEAPIQSLSNEEQRIETRVTSPATPATDKARESKGTYENWCFSDRKIFRLIPISEMKNILTKLQNLDVTVKAQEGIALISQLLETSKSITVTTNRRFPPDGEWYYCGYWVNDLHDILERIDNDCVAVNFNRSKSVIFKKFMKIGNEDGWTEAYNCAGNNYLLDITTPQSRLDQYLWLLCCLVHIEKNSSVSEFEVHDVTTFEKEYNLTWKQAKK